MTCVVEGADEALGEGHQPRGRHRLLVEEALQWAAWAVLIKVVPSPSFNHLLISFQKLFSEPSFSNTYLMVVFSQASQPNQHQDDEEEERP